jgi:uncharacterized protein
MARLDYFAPGVYIDQVNRGSRPIDGVQTNVGGFIGFTEDIRNGAELGKPRLVTSWNEYCQYFAREGSDGFTDFDAYLPFAVNGWFLNGGARCYIISVGTRLPGKEVIQKKEGATVVTAARKNALQFRLKEGWQGDNIIIEITDGEPLEPAASRESRSDSDAQSSPETGDEAGSDETASNADTPLPPKIPGEYFTLSVLTSDNVDLQEYEHLTMDPESTWGTYVGTLVSEHVSIVDLFEVDRLAGKRPPMPISRRPMNGRYVVQAPLVEYTANQFGGALYGDREEKVNISGSFEIDDINILAFPDLMKAYEVNLLSLDQVHGIMEYMVSLCETANPNPSNRMIVLDVPPDQRRPQEVVNWLDQFGRRSMYAALYYPWIQVPNPRKQGKSIMVPPCGHMMGIWSRTDETRGVYKAPANETPKGVIGLAYDCNFREQELLNPRGINCIRKFPNRGIKVWGARTLVEPDITDWRYISVRRLMSYIEKSIELGTQWVVFEPNDQDLWARVRRTVSNFLERLWREGALFGATSDQAFYVKCDETLNTPDTMILGRLYVEVGICPVRPAEFVVFQISQWTGRDEG